MGCLNNNTTVLYSCIAYALSQAPTMKKRRKNWEQYKTDNKTECLYWNQILENESTEGQNENYIQRTADAEPSTWSPIKHRSFVK